MAVVTMGTVRAGEGAFLFEEFERLSIVGIGGGESGRLCEFRPSGDVVTPAGRPPSHGSGPSDVTSSGRNYRLVPTMRVSGTVITYNGSGRSTRRIRRRRPHASLGHHWGVAQCPERQLARAWLFRPALAEEPERCRSTCIRVGGRAGVLSSDGCRNNLGGRTRKPNAPFTARDQLAHAIERRLKLQYECGLSPN